MDILNKKTPIVFTLILFAIVFVSAAPVVEININSHFNTGDVIKFSYTILSTQTETISYFASISCLGSPIALLDLKEANLEAGKIFSGEYSYGIVNDEVKSGRCIASISILEPYKLEFKKNFGVSSVSKFSINPLICKDSSCNEEAKVFIQEEKIYLNYSSSIEDILVLGILTYPDSSTKQINLPYNFIGSQIGTYKLDITASKEGYQDINIKEQFGVIEKNANIPYENAETGAAIDTNTGKNGVFSEDKKDMIDVIVRYILFFLIAIIILIIIVELIKNHKHRKFLE